MASIDLKKQSYTMAATVVSLLILMVNMIVYGSFIQLIPLAVMIPLVVHVMSEKKKRYDTKKLMNESPTVIGMMSVKIGSGGSLDSAVRDVADNGPRLSSKLFSEIVKCVDLRMIPDMKESIAHRLSELSEKTTSFKRSIQMVVSASEHKDTGEMKRMLRESETISLNGLKEMGETYSSSLNGPCMMIFGLGVMMPMIMMSILPMLSISGTFSVTVLSIETVSMITLIVIPCIVAVVVAAVMKGNPFLEKQHSMNDISYAIPLLIAIPASLLLYAEGWDPVTSMVTAAVPLSAFSFILLQKRIVIEKKKKKTETMLGHILFDLGGRLLAGENFDTAFIRSLESGKERTVSSEISNSLMMSRGDTAGALRSSLSKYSGAMAESYVMIYEASLKDPREAGHLAVSIGHQIQDRISVKTNIDNKMKNMTDMMTGTSMFFAPLIMGLSIILLKPLSSVIGSGYDGIGVILTLYLIELSLLISVLTSHLGNKGGILETTYRFSMMLPVSLIIFMFFSGLNI